MGIHGWDIFLKNYECVSLQVELEEDMIMKVIEIYLLGIMNFHGNPSNKCWDISVLTKVVDDQQTGLALPGAMRASGWC